MIDIESVGPEVTAAVRALIDELNVRIDLSSQHPTAFAMSALDIFAAHVIVGVAKLSDKATLVDVASMHCQNAREIAKVLEARRLAQEHNRGE